MTSKPQILIQPVNPLDPRPEELLPLVEELRRRFGDEHDIRLAWDEQRGYGVTWWEQLALWFASAVGIATINQVAQVIREYMQGRFKERYHEERPKLIKQIRFEDEQGRVFEYTEITAPDEEWQSREPDSYEARPLRKPTIRRDEERPDEPGEGLQP
jgi:hypothetical protein